MDIRDYFKYGNGDLICYKYFTKRVRLGDKLGGNNRYVTCTFNKTSKPLYAWVYFVCKGRFPGKVLFKDGNPENTKISNIIEVPSFKPLTMEWCRFHFEYKDGALLRRYSKRSFKANEECGTINTKGYRMITVYKKPYLAHRIVWAYFNNKFSKETIDHINGDKLDNRIENLRCATKSENSQNRKKAKGITFVKKTGKWQVQIYFNRKSKYLGTFESERDALHTRREAELKYYGVFAK